MSETLPWKQPTLSYMDSLRRMAKALTDLTKSSRCAESTAADVDVDAPVGGRRLTEAVPAATEGPHPDYHSRPLDDYDHDMSTAGEWPEWPDVYDAEIEDELERDNREKHQDA